MKTTIELPEDLMREVKDLADEQGKTLEEMLVEMIREIIHSNVPRERIRRLSYVEMPIIKGGRKALPGKEIAPERVAEILYGSGE